jgi:uncharacterized protein (UPF0335 family)
MRYKDLKYENEQLRREVERIGKLNREINRLTKDLEDARANTPHGKMLRACQNLYWAWRTQRDIASAAVYAMQQAHVQAAKNLEVANSLAVTELRARLAASEERCRELETEIKDLSQFCLSERKP